MLASRAMLFSIMKAKYTIFATATFCFLVSCTNMPSGSKSDQNGIVATVDGVPISLSDIQLRINIDAQKYDPIELKTQDIQSKIKKRALQDAIQETILLNEAKKEGISITNEETTRSIKKKIAGANLDEIVKSSRIKGISKEQWLNLQRDRLIMDKLLKAHMPNKGKIIPDKIANYYRLHQTEFIIPKKYHARQILIGTKEKAEKILAKLEKGANFAEIAKKNSISPDKIKGGDIGFFDPHVYPKVFSKICSKLHVGEISKVIATDYGYQIFQLLGESPSKKIPLSEATPIIIKKISAKRSTDALANWLQGLKKKSRIIVKNPTMKGVIFNDNIN